MERLEGSLMRSWRMYPLPHRGCQVSQPQSPRAAEGIPTVKSSEREKEWAGFQEQMYHKGYLLGLKMPDTHGYPNLWICYDICKAVV